MDLKISKKVIEKTLPNLFFPGRFNYLKKGKIKNIFKKIVTMSIPNENNSVSAKKLNKIAIKNKINSQVSSNLTDALKKISNKEKKIIICFGSLYNAGFILNKN